MTSFNAESATVPYSEVLYPMLRVPQDAALYLEDAFEDKHDRHAVINALKDIILANKAKWTLPFLAIYFSVGRINANKLEDAIDFMEENIEPNVRTYVANTGGFAALRSIASAYRKYGNTAKYKLNFNIEKNTEFHPGPGILSAQKALYDAFSEDENKSILLEMQTILNEHNTVTYPE